MIKIAFMTLNKKIIRFEVEGSKVLYFDDIWTSGVQIYPMDVSFVNKLRISRNGDMKVLAALIIDANSGKDLMEYRSCKGDENKIAGMIIKDCKSKGLVQV